MELTLESIRKFAEQAAQYQWHQSAQRADEFWASSLLEGGAFDVVVEMVAYVMGQCGESPSAVDLGAADGVMVLLMHYCGFRAYGIEKVAERLAVARRSCAVLGLADEVGLALGDWTEDGSYRQMGVGVGDIDFFYIYASPGGAVKAFEMMAERARLGAILAVNVAAPSAEQEVPDCLELDARFEMSLGRIDIYKKIDRTFTELSF